MSNYKLDDKTISQIAKCVQVAILTGTDVVDHLRQLELTTTENSLITISDEYLSVFDKNIEKMLQEAVDLQQKKETQETNTEQLSLFS